MSFLVSWLALSVAAAILVCCLFAVVEPRRSGADPSVTFS